jgi:hypothetical protein
MIIVIKFTNNLYKNQKTPFLKSGVFYFMKHLLNGMPEWEKLLI